MKITYLTCLAFLSTVSVFPQGYYPLEIGNVWQYNDCFDKSYLYTTRAYYDTTMPNGKSYTFLLSKRDTNTIYAQYFRQEGTKVFTYSVYEEKEFLWFDFSKTTNDTVSYNNYGGDSTIVLVAYDRMVEVFGVIRRQWGFYEKSLSSSVYILREVTDSIGNTYLNYEASPYDDCLSGAIINGIQYGTITNVEPDPESFFPTQVGNLWQYYGSATLWQNWNILKDSIADDGYRYLYIGFERYPGQEQWLYRIDSAFSIYKGRGNNSWGTLYHLDADSGDVWLGSLEDSGYSWVYDVTEAIVFGRKSTIKIIRSGPFHPDSGGSEFWHIDQYLASEFGVIYHKEEANPFEPIFLAGCVIDGDTFGTITSIEDIRSDLPGNFVLEQNYPNPFNLSTTIEFSIPNEAYIHLNIYDLLGRKIRVLINERRSAGNYKVSFYGSNLSSGLYIARLCVNENTKTIKMLMTK